MWCIIFHLCVCNISLQSKTFLHGDAQSHPTPPVSLSSLRQQWSVHHCLMIGTTKVIFIRCSICKHRRRHVLAALHTSEPACVGDRWQFCVKISPQISAPWKGERREMVCAEASDMWKMQKRLKAHLLHSPSAVCLWFLNNSEPEEQSLPGSFYLSVCYRSTSRLVTVTRTALTSVAKLFIRYEQNGGK